MILRLNVLRSCFMTVDPSVGSLGWAIWGKGILSFPETPLDVGLLTQPSSSGTFPERARRMASRLLQVVSERRPQAVVIECPVFYASDAGGEMVASSGDLGKLYMVVGAIVGSLPASIDPLLLKVPEWKGQLPKHIINRRIEAALGPESCARFYKDIWDAVGLGLFLGGHINRDIQRPQSILDALWRAANAGRKS